MNKLLVAALCCGAFAAGPASAQLVVIDKTNLVQALNTARNTLQAAQKAAQQVEEARRMYDAVNHVTDIGSVAAILNDPKVQRGLPPEIAASLRSGRNDFSQMGELGARARAIYGARDFSSGTSAVDGALGSATEMLGRGAARDAATAQNALEVAEQRGRGLGQLSSRLSSADNAMDVQAINARAAIEAAAAANQTNQLLAAQAARDAELDARNAATMAAESRARRSGRYMSGGNN
jgi:type IV secretion system protein VirB5